MQTSQRLAFNCYGTSWSGNYKTAENNIIRSAIPLLNKAKAYEGKIFAWEMLAEIYFKQINLPRLSGFCYSPRLGQCKKTE
jgi:hypothetical protein